MSHTIQLHAVELVSLRSPLRAHAPAMRRPETRTWPLGAEQLHGRDGVAEEVAEAEHGTDEDT